MEDARPMSLSPVRFSGSEVSEAELAEFRIMQLLMLLYHEFSLIEGLTEKNRESMAHCLSRYITTEHRLDWLREMEFESCSVFHHSDGNQGDAQSSKSNRLHEDEIAARLKAGKTWYEKSLEIYNQLDKLHQEQAAHARDKDILFGLNQISDLFRKIIKMFFLMGRI